MSDFVHAVAARVGTIDDAKVAEILTRHGVRESGILPKPHRLLVKRVAFTGEKSGTSHQPIDFSWDLGAGLWCLAADNLRGKSSVLEIIWWCLRGAGDVQADVRKWIRHVSLEASVDDEPFTVTIDVNDDELTGTLTTGTQPHANHFTGEAEFSSIMGTFMMDRLALELLRGWRKDSAAPAADGDGEEADGQVTTTGWPAYSHALLCRNRKDDALLGETAGGGTMVSLLQMFVGLPWTTTRRDARAALELLQQGMRGERRRAQQDLTARGASVKELEGQLAEAQKALDSAPSLGTAVAAVEQAAARLAQLTGQQSDLAAAAASTRQAEDELHETLVIDQSRLRDIRETAAAQRFFGALRPTCCPRCSTSLDQLPHASLDEAHCRICGSAPAAVPVDPSAADDLAATIATLKDAHGRARRAARTAASAAERGQGALDQARADFAQARAAVPTQSALRAHIEVARLKGALEERCAASAHAKAPQGASIEEAVLEAAQKEADKRTKMESQDLLNAVSEEICRLGIRLGIRELQKITLQANGVLQVTKGGSRTVFTKVVPGEQLRLRVATLLALLRVGRESGVGRHPGLLLLDSAGAQETIPADLAEVLSQLRGICQETPGLQVITATANRAIATSTIAPENLQIAAPGEPVW